MRTKFLAAFVAGGLLVGAGLLTSVILAPGTAQAHEGTDEESERGPVSRILGFLGGVLDDLVEDGTITQDQADAIAEATEDKLGELREERLGLRELLSGVLDDGVITEEETSELADDHWIFGDAFEEAWEDGELTVDEIREAIPLHRGHAFKRGFRFGAFLDDGGIDAEEYESLSEDHPLKQIDVSDQLEDGLITPGELREVLHDLMHARFGDDA